MHFVAFTLVVDLNQLFFGFFIFSLILLVLLAFSLGLLLFFDLCGKLFVTLAVGVQVVQVEHVHDVLLLEDELLNLAGNDGRDSSGLLSVLEEDQRRQLAGQSRRVDVVLRAHVRISANVDFTWKQHKTFMESIKAASIVVKFAHF